VCKGATYDTDLLVDINAEVYSVRVGDKLSIAVTSTLRRDGRPAETTWDQSGEVLLSPTIAYFRVFIGVCLWLSLSLYLSISIYLCACVSVSACACAPCATQESLLDDYDYGMCGRVFQYDYKAEHKVDIFASFGGLLMLLQGDQLSLKNIEHDQMVFLLVRKVGT
jgi:DNA-directed RNA polymerase I, II, and III subunit RPABC3